MGSCQSKGRSQGRGLMGVSGEDEEERSQWSDLPPELIQSIYGKVADGGGYIRLRAVSTAWRSAVMPIDQSSHPQYPPWLMLPYSQHSAARSFLSLVTNRVCTIRLPEARGKVICGSSYGWFVLLHAKTESVSLLNLVTGSQIQLPPATHFPHLAGLRGDRFRLGGGRYQGTSGARVGSELYIGSAFLTSNPAADPPERDCIVIATLPVGSKFAFCRPCSDEWTILDTTLSFVAAVAYHGGKFYAIDCEGNTAICRPPSKATLVPSMKVPSGFDECSMVKPSGTGELLMLTFTFRGGGDGARVNIFCNVFRLDESGGGEEAMRWSKVSSIGDHAVFVSRNHCSCVPARGIAGCMANCAYFVVPRGGFKAVPSRIHRDLDVSSAKHPTAGYEILRSDIHLGMESPAMPVDGIKQISRQWNKPWGEKMPLWI